MKHAAALFVFAILFLGHPASALTVAEFLQQNGDIKGGFLTGAVDMAVITTTQERGDCILKWYTSDPTASVNEIARAIKAADPHANAVGVLIEIIWKHCGM